MRRVKIEKRCFVCFWGAVSLAASFLAPLCGLGQNSDLLSLSEIYAPGDEVKIQDMTLYVKDVSNKTLTLSLPVQPTAVIGDMITPVSASGTPGQSGTGRTPNATINASGLKESFPESGFFVHTNKIDADGSSTDVPAF